MSVPVKHVMSRGVAQIDQPPSTERAEDNGLKRIKLHRSHVNNTLVYPRITHGHMHFPVQMELDKLQTDPLTLRGPTTTRELPCWFVMSACWPSLTTLKGMACRSPQQTEDERGTREIQLRCR